MSNGKYSKEIVDEICKYIRAGNNYEDSAILAHIGVSTFYDWQRQLESDGSPNPAYHVEFVDALKEAERECKARNIALIQKAGEKQWQAAAWYLERKYNNEYALKQINEIGGIMNPDGTRQEIGLFVNLGQGFVPTNIALPAASNGGTTSESAKIQGSNMAQKSKKNIHRTNRTNKTGTR